MIEIIAFAGFAFFLKMVADITFEDKPRTDLIHIKIYEPEPIEVEVELDINYEPIAIAGCVAVTIFGLFTISYIVSNFINSYEECEDSCGSCGSCDADIDSDSGSDIDSDIDNLNQTDPSSEEIICKYIDTQLNVLNDLGKFAQDNTQDFYKTYSSSELSTCSSGMDSVDIKNENQHIPNENVYTDTYTKEYIDFMYNHYTKLQNGDISNSDTD